MKPIYLEMQAFGPYVENQKVDFNELGEKGIFLIKGPTGSGKTTIFDAMTFALYGGGSGESEKSKTGRNDFDQWRCNQAPDNVDTIIAFEFEIAGRRFLFKRTMTKKTKNFATVLEAGEKDEQGNLIPFFENPKKDDLNKKATELLGLTKEQFSQVILLPQGQFEKFLTASSEEKEKILTKIFGTEKWSKIAIAFFDEASAEKKALEDKKKEVEDVLKSYNVSSLEELACTIEGKKAELNDVETKHRDYDGEKKREALNIDRQVAAKFDGLHKLENDEIRLHSMAGQIAEKQDKLAAAENAEKLRDVIREYLKSAEDEKKRKASFEKLNEKTDGITAAVKLAYDELEEHKKNSPVDEYTKKIGEYESKEESYKKYQEKKVALASAESEFKKAKSAFDAASELLDEKKQDAVNAKNAADKADDVAKDYRDRYFKGIYGEIASELAENTPCPVCGSLSHPHPAEKHPESVSKQEYEAKEKLAEKAKKAFLSADNARIDAENRNKDAETVCNQKKLEKESAQSSLDELSSNLIEGVADINALNKKIDELKSLREAYNSKTSLLEGKYSAAVQTQTSHAVTVSNAGEELETAVKEFDKAKTELNAALEEYGYADIDAVNKDLLDAASRKYLLEEITSYSTSCKLTKENKDKAKEELEGISEPDSSKFDERDKEISEEGKVFAASQSRIKKEIESLSGVLERYSGMYAEYKDNKGRAESDVQFAKKLRGDTGVGLQRYILAVMFNNVIGEANRMLTKVHGGRYRLFRTDDKGNGNKRGLELMVHDSRSPEKEGRSVSMLSGGEKFLVSLSLSIGLSTVAQRTGVKIDSLFIDEGFGTLDGKSINDALEILEQVREGNGLIGIISHVPALEELPVHLEVIKTDDGSRLRTVRP